MSQTIELIKVVKPDICVRNRPNSKKNGGWDKFEHISGCGDVLYDNCEFVQSYDVALINDMEATTFSIKKNPFRSLEVFGIDDSVFEKSWYTCPYTDHRCNHIVPTMLFTPSLKSYEKDDMWYNHIFDWEYLIETTGLKTFIDGGKKELLSWEVADHLKGSGYTDFTMDNDGHGRHFQGLMPLDNGDYLGCFYWVWYNK